MATEQALQRVDGIMRVSADVGGTFTDLVVETAPGPLPAVQGPDDAEDPAVGVFDALRLAAAGCGSSLETFLASVDMLIHATTRRPTQSWRTAPRAPPFSRRPDIPTSCSIAREGDVSPSTTRCHFPRPMSPAA